MTEPVYTFKPGEGWVIERCQTAVVKMANGKLIEIQLRKPSNGEKYVWTISDWNLEKWKSWAFDAYLFHNTTKGWPDNKPLENGRPINYCTFRFL